MILLGAILLGGLVLGWALGGRLRNLAGVHIRAWPILPLALALQFVPVPQGEGLARYHPIAVIVVSYVIVIAVLALNLRLTAFAVILVGTVLNLIVIAANLGMPVSREAIVASENLSLLVGLPTERGLPYHEANEEDVLLPLADVIPVREPFGVVVSVGDVLTYGGAAFFLTAAMVGRPQRRPRPRRSGPPASSTTAEPSGTPP